MTTAITTAPAPNELDALRMENAELRRQLDDFRAGYIRQTDRLLIALDALRQVAHERRVVTQWTS